MPDAAVMRRGMAAIGAGVSVASAVAPARFLRAFGVPREDVTGAATLGWRLFAVRTAYLSALAWKGDATATDAFCPVQVLDQAVFWHAFSTRSVPRRTSVLAAATSGVIVALDVQRRRSP